MKKAKIAFMAAIMFAASCSKENISPHNQRAEIRASVPSNSKSFIMNVQLDGRVTLRDVYAGDSFYDSIPNGVYDVLVTAVLKAGEHIRIRRNNYPNLDFSYLRDTGIVVKVDQLPIIDRADISIY